MDAVGGLAGGTAATASVDWKSALGPEWCVWETKHPYQDNADDPATLQIVGANRLIVVFDPATKTELNYDYLKLFKGVGESTPLLNGEPLSGDYHPMWDEKDPIQVDGDTLSLKFHSDGGKTEWGIRMFIRGISDKPHAMDMEDEKFSLRIRDSALLPMSIRTPELYVFELYERLARQMRAGSGASRRDLEMMYATELQTMYRSGTPHSLGLFFAQRIDKAKQNYLTMVRMKTMFAAIKIIGLCVPELSKDELKNVVGKVGKSGGVFLKLVWNSGRLGAFAPRLKSQLSS